MEAKRPVNSKPTDVGTDGPASDARLRLQRRFDPAREQSE
jgi:hypothetical protein